MPIVVIGGGLTATDTACEAQAYYATQVKKFSDKFN
jgi:NADPH-dependent glutamate synthase beta subunit-like oxidoreductase